MQAVNLPGWPSHVHTLVTTRGVLENTGVSQPPFDRFNVASHVGDKKEHVMQNRRLLRKALPSEPVWLEQIHSTKLIDASGTFSAPPVADASYSHRANVVCAVMTADCLPVLFTNQSGTVVAAAHAGWRGLLAGILEITAQKISDNPDEILVWLGPAIGPESFEVGEEVKEAFVQNIPATESAFVARPQGKFLADMYQLARLHLAQIGVTQVTGGGFDTMIDTRYYSYRAAPKTGRMVSLVWHT